jgi:hypothetical protein
MLAVFAFQLLQVRRWSVRVPISDEWQTIKIFGPAEKSGVRLSMLWEQHNEHRIPIANAVFLLVRRLGGWVVLAPNIVSALMVAVTVGVVVRTLLHLQVRALIVVIAVVTAVTPLQWENTIWGFQVQFAALVMGVVVTVCCMALHPVVDRRTLLTVIVGSLWCSGTISSGLLTWVLCAALVIGLGLAARQLRHAARAAALIAAVGAVVVVLFRIGYVAIDRQGNGGAGNYVRWMGRALTFPHTGFGGGAAVDRNLPMGVVLGAVIGAGMLCVLMAGLGISWDDRGNTIDLGRLVFCGGLSAWVAAQVVLIGYARAGFSMLASRYGSVLIWLLVAALVAADRVIDRAPAALSRLAVVVIALSTVQHIGLIRSVDSEAKAWGARASLESTKEFFERGLSGNVASPNPYANERVFGELLRESKAKGWLGQLPDPVLTELQWKPTVNDGQAWSLGGEYVTGGAVASRRWASWSGSDAAVGVLLSQPIRVTSDVMTVKVFGGPEQEGNRLELVDDSGQTVIARFSGPAAQGGEAVWSAPTQVRTGDTVRLRAVDNATGYLGWFGMEAPHQPSRLMRAVDRLIRWSPGLLLVAMGLALMGALGPGRVRRA